MIPSISVKVLWSCRFALSGGGSTVHEQCQRGGFSEDPQENYDSHDSK